MLGGKYVTGNRFQRTFKEIIMTRVTFSLLCVLLILGLSAPAFAAEGDEAPSLVSLKDKVLTFMENPVIYESTNVTIKLHADLRFRVEDFDHFDNYYYGSTEKRDNFMTSRLIVGLDYQVKKIFSFNLEFIDARAYSYFMYEEPSNIDNPIDLNRAWIAITPESYPFSFEIGRNYLTIASGKLIGKSDWDNVPWRFETVKLGIKQEKWNIQLAYAKPVFPDKDNRDQATLRENHDWYGDINDEYKYAGLWGGYTFNEKITLNGYAMFKTDDDDNTQDADGTFGDHRVYAYGIWAFGRFNDIHYDLDLTFQGGNRSTEDIKAWNLEAELKWAPDVEYKPEIALGFCIASGDDSKFDNEYNTFDPMFGDYLDKYGIVRAVAPMNVKIFTLKGAVCPVKNFRVGLSFFMFERAEDSDAWYSSNGQVYLDSVFDSKTIGSEIDFIAEYYMSEYSTISLGFGYFFGSDMLEDNDQEERIKLMYLSYQIKVLVAQLLQIVRGCPN